MWILTLSRTTTQGRLPNGGKRKNARRSAAVKVRGFIRKRSVGSGCGARLAKSAVTSVSMTAQPTAETGAKDRMGYLVIVSEPKRREVEVLIRK